MRIAIISKNRQAYSETFIRNGIEKLQGDKEVYYGNHLPHSRGDSGQFYPPPHFLGRLGWKVYQRVNRKTPSEVAQAALAREFMKFQPDVVLAHYAQAGVEVKDVCRQLGIPLVVHCHGHDVHMKNVLAAYGDSYAALGRESFVILAVSDVMREALIELGVPENKIRRIWYGVDLEQFSLTRHHATGEPLFLSVGRFAEKKAPYLVILSFKKVLESIPGARLAMIGDGDLQNSCRELTKAFGLQEKVEFLGARTHEEVAESMGRARAYVQHSLVPQWGVAAGDHEGTPLGVLEAGARGLPVISTRHAGIMEAVVDGETGFLVEERDVAGMARRMIQVGRDPDLARRLGDAARRRMEEMYSLDRYIEHLQKACTEAANSKGSSERGTL